MLDFRGGRTRTILHVAGPHFLCRHQICEDILIGSSDMPPKRNMKITLPGGGILLLAPKLTLSFGDLRMCHRAKCQRNRTIGSRVITILPFYHFGPALGPPLGHWLSELGHPVPPSEVCSPSVLESFFRFPKKPPN